MTPQETIQQLNWRYAVKAFDPSKKIPSDLVDLAKETLRLAPSSFGLQAWKFLFVSDEDALKKIEEKAWGQKQVTQSSEFIVLCRPAKLDEELIDRFITSVAETRGATVDSLAGYSKVIKGFVTQMSDEKKAAWMNRQIYIALGGLMTVMALHGVDTCPMEGFEPPAVDEILGLEAKGLKSVVLCGLGYRAEDDKYAKAPKVRFPTDQVIETI